MLRKKLSKLRATLARYAQTTEQLLRLEAENAILEAQRDRLAELLVEERKRKSPAESLPDIHSKLLFTLNRFDAVPDGEPSVEELFDVLIYKLRNFDEREAEAIDIGERNGWLGYSSPALVETLVEAVKDRDEELREARAAVRGVDRLTKWKLEAGSLIDDVIVNYASKKSLQRPVRELSKFRSKKLSEFDNDERAAG